MKIIFAVYIITLVGGTPTPHTFEAPAATMEQCLNSVAAFFRDGPKPGGNILETGAACILQPDTDRPA